MSARACEGHDRKQTGAALLMVLWTFAVVAALAGQFARAMREEAQSTLNYKNETIAHYVAIAGLNEALLAIVARNGKVDAAESDATGENDLDDKKEEEREGARTVRRLLLGRGDWIDGKFDGHSYQVRVFDETGKISLNAEVLDESNLPTILENLGLDKDSASVISDSILDWRDDNDAHRDNGAEDEYYEGLDRPYPAKDGPFDAVEELLLVRGVTREIFYGDAEFPGLKDVFTTVHSSSRVNITAVSPAVEIALCGEQLLDEEEKKKKEDDPFGPSEDEFLADLSTCLQDLNFPIRRTTGRARARLNQATIEVRVPDEQDDRRTVSQVGVAVWFKEDGFQALRWYDSIFSEKSR